MKKWALFAPSTYIEEEQVLKIKDAFSKYNLSTVFNSKQFKKERFFAGRAEVRANILSEFIADSEIEGIICARGGSGSIHMLPFLEKMSFTTWKEKSIVGFSDATTLLYFIHHKLNWITYHGHVGSTFLKTTKKEKDSFIQQLLRNSQNQNVKYEYTSEIQCFQNGTVTGKLLGGNIATLVSLLATPWQMDLDHSILFLEDINEAPYKIERFISQLYYSGSLQKVQGLILGEFYYKNELLNMKEILPVFASYFPKNIPILYQFPSGHGTKNQMLPIGCNITLTTNPNEIRSVNPNV